MQIKDILQVLEEIAPPDLQESYDNSGLLIGNSDARVEGVLFCLDSTEDIIEEAVALGCNLVVAHHPIIFRGLKRLNGQTYIERTVLKAILHNVAVYAMHTNLDNVYHQGVNARIAAHLGLEQTRLLAPKAGRENAGAGMIGVLPEAMEEIAFLEFVKKALPTACVRHTALRGKPVRTVAVCGGAGSFLLGQALQAGADAFVSADFKYHEFFDADGRLLIADVGHFESEQFTIELLRDIVRKKFPTFALHLTKRNTNPVFYH